MPASGTLTGRYYPSSREHALDYFWPGMAARKGNLLRRKSPQLGIKGLAPVQ
jgi:hypothetical protein